MDASIVAAAMPDVSPVLAAGLVMLFLAVMLGFALGTGRNVSRGNDILRWLQAGLPLIGRKTTLRWLGSSVVELAIADANDPFREATVLTVLEPRDLVWLWPIARRRGRRDFLVVRCSLKRAPRIAVEVADRRAWTGRDRPRQADEEEWQPVEAWTAHVRASVAMGADGLLARRLWDRLAAASAGPWRLSVRRTVPHLEVHVLAPGTADASADRLFRAVREIALEVSPDR
jgi:hypothetical protein